MPLVYGAVARSGVVLAEYSAVTGNFNSVLVGLLQKIQNNEGRCSMNVDKHVFCFINNNGYSASPSCLT
jgi:hypothetical protein